MRADTRIYTAEITKAIEEAIAGDGQGSPTTETLLANLAARGFFVVEAPPGINYDFVGIAP